MNGRTLAITSLSLICSCRHSRELPPVDLTIDLHHRLKAQMFLHDREPLVLVCKSLHDRKPAPGAPIWLRSELGSLGVRADSLGNVVTFFLGDMVYAHPCACAPAGYGVERDFNEWPRYPIGGSNKSPLTGQILGNLPPKIVRAPCVVGDILPPMADTSTEFEMVVLGLDGRPVPFAVVCIQVDDVGGFGLQADAAGCLGVSFGRDWVATDAAIVPLAIPIGQALWTDEFARVSRQIPGWAIQCRKVP
jgi:hypothetical protein